MDNQKLSAEENKELMEKYKKMIRNSDHVKKEKKKKKVNSRTNGSNGIRRTPTRDIVKRTSPHTSNTRRTPTRTTSRATPRTSDTRPSPLQRDSRDSSTIIVPTTTPYDSPRGSPRQTQDPVIIANRGSPRQTQNPVIIANRGSPRQTQDPVIIANRGSPRQTQNPVITANFAIDGQNLEATQNTAVDQRAMLLQENRKPLRNIRKNFAEVFRKIGLKKKKEAEKEKVTQIFAPSEKPLFKSKPRGEPLWTKDQDRETEKPVYMRFYSPTRQGFYYKHIESGLIGWNLVKLRDEVREMGFVGGGKLYKKAKKAKKAKKVKKVKKEKKEKKEKKVKKDKKRKKSKKSKKGKK